MKLLTTEREAWLYIARQFARYVRVWKRGDGWRRRGLCLARGSLYNIDKIRFDTSEAMRATLCDYADRHPSQSPYFFPLTKGGARKRAALARQFAKESR